MAALKFLILTAYHRMQIRVRAIKDARVNLNTVDDLIVSMFGPRPKPFAPAEVDRHRMLQHQRTNIAKSEELTQDVHRKEDAHKQKWSPNLMWCLVGILYFIEFCGSADILRKAGVVGGTVLVYAAMLTTAMFAEASMCARQQPRTSAYYVWYAIFFATGLAAAVIRYHELVASEEASSGESFALAALMFAITVFPAWLAEVFIRKALDGRETARDLALTRRELKNEQQTIQAAHREVDAIAERVEQYDHLAGLVRAEYRRHWLYERKRVDPNAPITTMPEETA